jgi:YgiT-type zinc finger domain-containing protein
MGTSYGGNRLKSNMTCAYCRGNYENGFTTYMSDMGNCVIIVKNVPCLICDQCGEVSYHGAVYERLEQIVGMLRDSATEVAIIKYSEAAA